MSSPLHDDLARRILASKTDYYAVLQVSRSDDEKAIRRSYHRLSLKLHPDKNPGNVAAEEAYRVVNHCYEILMDRDKRSFYDTFGEEGMSRYAQFGEDFPPVGEVLQFLAKYFGYRVLRRASMRSGCSELLDEIFPDIAAAAASVKSDSEAAFYAHQSFVKSHAEQKRKDRRRLRIFLVAISVILCVLATVNRFVYPILPSADLCGPAGCGPTGAPVLGEADRIRQLQEELLYPPPSSSASRRGGEVVEPVTITLRGSCLVLDDAHDVLCCQASPATHGENASSLGAEPDFTVPLSRYGGNDADSIIAFHALVREECQREALFAAASRDRYADTTTLHKKGPLPMPKSPNRAPKRKYAERRWRPKFMDSYSVTQASELYHMSPLCAKLSQLRA